MQDPSMDDDRYRLLFERAPLGIFHFDAAGVIRACNERFLSLLGASAEAMHGFDMLAQVKNPGVLAAVRAALEGREGRYEGPYQSVSAGRRTVIRLSAFPLKGEDGASHGALGLVEDITDAARVESELGRVQALLRASLEQTPAGVIIADGPVFRARMVNPAAAEILGMPLEEARMIAFEQADSFPWTAYQVDGSRCLPQNMPLALAITTGATIRNRELRIVRGDGSERWILANASPIRDGEGNILGGVVVFPDITESRRAKEALAASEAQFRTLTEQAADAILVGDSRGVIIGANPRAAGLTGRPMEALLGTHIRELFSSGMLEQTPLRFDLLDLGQRVIAERDLLRADGSSIPIEMSSVRLADGRYQAILRDQSERLEADRRLRETEARYLDLFNHTPESIFRIRVELDGGFVVEAANPAQLAALGLTAERMVDKRLEEFLPPDLAEIIAARYRACLAKGESLAYEESADLPQGRRWYQTLLVPIRSEEGQIRHLVGFSRDITDRKLAEEALRQASKLESLGVLAGGIAHDFNNLLTIVLGNLDLTQSHLADPLLAKEFLVRADQAVLKASELTRQMLAYSGRGHFVVQPQDLNTVVQELTHLLQVSISKRTTLRLQLGPDLPAVDGDAAQLHQVVMNLVTNASDAIGDADGVITVETRVEVLDEAEAQKCFPANSLHPGRHVALSVSDTGSGMAPDVVARIFDPFFTTKATGRGLGLSAMLGILRGHGAGLRIATEPGRGSRFEIFFPASEGAAQAPAAHQEGSPGVLQGLALVVDDEPDLRRMVADSLRVMGFEVIQAADGIEATECFIARPEEFKIVLLDLTMPRMDGARTCEALRKIRADVPIILSSGYNEQESIRPLLEQGLTGFLPKPYQLKELRRIVGEVLGAE